MNIERIMSSLEAKHPGESEYLQAVKGSTSFYRRYLQSAS